MRFDGKNIQVRKILAIAALGLAGFAGIAGCTTAVPTAIRTPPQPPRSQHAPPAPTDGSLQQVAQDDADIAVGNGALTDRAHGPGSCPKGG